MSPCSQAGSPVPESAPIYEAHEVACVYRNTEDGNGLTWSHGWSSHNLIAQLVSNSWGSSGTQCLHGAYACKRRVQYIS